MPPVKPAKPLRITLLTGAAAASDFYAAALFQGEGLEPAGLPPAVVAAARRLRSAGFGGDAGESRQAAVSGGGLLLLQGLGARAGADTRTFQEAVQAIWTAAGAGGAAAVLLKLPRLTGTGATISLEALLRSILLAGYRFDRFRSASAPGSAPTEVRLLLAGGERSAPAARRALASARSAAAAIAYGRDLANTPPNEATPGWMVARARELARRHGMRVQVLGPRELAARGMGGILAVGSGSAQPPRLVRLEWGSGPFTVALVGKGVTFDTGGISIKPAAAMDEMKYDKSGACTVLAVMAAAAQSRLPLRLRAYLPLVENMPGSASYRPGDILRCHNGKTVEVINTDAEGRLILADALSWAASERPDAMVAFATLTGACVVALGHTGAGLFTPNDGMAEELLTAAASAGERLWRLPLWPEFAADMKGTHADLRNQGSRWGGASNAAAFLSHFVGEVERWAHLDIAGPAYVGADGGGGGLGAKGATGWGVATTLAWLRTLR